MKYNLKSANIETGARLKKIREHFKLSQKEFAARTELGTSSICELEAQNTFPSYGFIMKLYEEFQVNPNYLLLGLGNMLLDQKQFRVYEFDFGDQMRETVAMINQMERSPVFRSLVLATAMQIMNSHEEIIKIDIQTKEAMKKLKLQEHEYNIYG